MKEKIYTIPVTEAFAQDSECPLCLLESKLECDYTEYYLGPALMEPDCRIDTNRKGFCRRHFELMYNRQENRLGLGLVTDTHMRELIERMRETGKPFIEAEFNPEARRNVKKLSLKDWLFHRNPAGTDAASAFVRMLDEIEESCTICSRMEYTMDRYLDVIMYLWSKEEKFRAVFEEKKGFCLVHLKQLIIAAGKYLSADEGGRFISRLIVRQIENMERIERELEWFTKKFDYRNNDAPWGNSKDALPRSIQKLKSYCAFK
ncbi:MAG: DUF6062 family protein [Bacillota bacterium]